ncbi:MAG: ribose-phosphate pyrophosphokinase [Defluviitaleaceae bacterium]|nr:ribose-phosphate pyrophosphokinase [Defluviitaleaceae bacterium]
MRRRNHGYGDIKLFTCNANPFLGNAIADFLNNPLGDSTVGKFSDGEISVRFDETVRGLDVFVVQPTSYPVNDNLMELLIMTDALRRASAGRITAVMPYFGYARQDRKDRSHAPISAKLVANLLSAAGIDRILAMDLHCPQIQGFFDVPVDHLRGTNIFAKYYCDHLAHLGEFVVVSPDLGSVSRVRAFAEKIDLPLAIVDKRRPKADVSEITNIIGGEEIKGKNAILLDDIIATGGSLLNAAQAIKDLGATAVYACVTHPVLSGDAKDKIESSVLDKLLVLDTIYVPQEKRSVNMEILSVAEYFAKAITCIHEGKAISSLFDDEA